MPIPAVLVAAGVAGVLLAKDMIEEKREKMAVKKRKRKGRKR